MKELNPKSKLSKLFSIITKHKKSTKVNQSLHSGRSFSFEGTPKGHGLRDLSDGGC